MAEIYDGLPFFIGSGTKVSENKLPDVQNAVGRRTRDVSEWRNRYYKGLEIRKSIHDREAGAVQNVNMMYAYNADYTVDVERPTTVLKSYLDALQNQNDLLADDAITFGCAALLLDVDLDNGQPQPGIMLNRVRSSKIIYDFEQPGSGIFTIRVTPELAFKYKFLSEHNRMNIFNRAKASA